MNHIDNKQFGNIFEIRLSQNNIKQTAIIIRQQLFFEIKKEESF